MQVMNEEIFFKEPQEKKFFYYVNIKQNIFNQ